MSTMGRRLTNMCGILTMLLYHFISAFTHFPFCYVTTSDVGDRKVIYFNIKFFFTDAF